MKPFVIIFIFLMAFFTTGGSDDWHHGISGVCYRGNQPDSTKTMPYTSVRYTQTDQENYDEWMVSDFFGYYHFDDHQYPYLPQGTHNYDMYGRKVLTDTTFTSDIVNVKHMTDEDTKHNVYLVHIAVPPQKE